MLIAINASLVNALVPALSGLAGVGIGGWITSHNQKRERRETHIKDQLSEFYSPLLGIRSQIKAKSEVRLKVSNAAQALWPAKFAGIDDPMVKKQISDTDFPAYEKLLDYNNRQLTEEIIPLYRKMLEIFTDRMWLAEVSTVRHYPALVEFVEVWNRFLDKSLPREVIDQIEHKEENLKPFYDDLQKHFTELSQRLR
jgi:hypothetical protein